MGRHTIIPYSIHASSTTRTVINKNANLVVYSIWYINAYLISSRSHLTRNCAISGHLASKISLHVLGAICGVLFLLYIWPLFHVFTHLAFCSVAYSVSQYNALPPLLYGDGA
jgi:hypothetical protein